MPTTNSTGQGAPAAAADNSGTASSTNPELWNGATYDRQRNNTPVLLESGAFSGSGGGNPAINYNARGAFFNINVTAVAGTTPTLVVKYQAQDGISGVFYDIPGAVTASITAAGMYAIQVYPGITETANARVNYALPRVVRAFYTFTGAGATFTLSSAVNFIV